MKSRGKSKDLVTRKEADEFVGQFECVKMLELDNGEDAVEVVISKKTIKRFREVFQVMMVKRGIRDVESITDNDGEVARAVQERADIDKDLRGIMYKLRAAKRLSSRERKVWEGMVTPIVERIKARYQPHQQSLQFLVMAWALTADSLFTIKGKSLEFRLDYDPPEEFWKGEYAVQDTEVTETDPFLALAEQDSEVQFVPTIDRESPNEFMLGSVLAMLNSNSEFLSELSDLIQQALMYESILRMRLEGIERDEFFLIRERVVPFLASGDGEPDSNGNGDNVTVRVRPANGASGRKRLESEKVEAGTGRDSDSGEDSG